jgi:hypothetical protein
MPLHLLRRDPIMDGDKEKVLRRMALDLDWLYDNAEDKGERGAVSHVEDIVHNWLDAEIDKRFVE